jgi:raffinose/stachyose/melibiose transport system permease protein
LAKTGNIIAESRTVKTVKGIISTVLIVYTFITLFLIGNTILSSFKTKQDLINNTIGFPRKFTLANYNTLLFKENFLRYFFNSLLLVFCSLMLLLLVSTMVSYGISKFEFKGKGLLQTYFLIGLMFPIQLGILPLFIMLTKAHLNNNIFGLALLYAGNMSFPVLVFSKFFRGISDSLIESARIDGAKEFMVFLRIILPMSKPVLFTMGLINFVSIWNDFYMPLVFLTKTSVKTLTLGVYAYMANFLANWHLVFAAVVVALLPVIIIFFRFSDQIVAGLAGGAVKE